MVETIAFLIFVSAIMHVIYRSVRDDDLVQPKKKFENPGKAGQTGPNQDRDQA